MVLQFNILLVLFCRKFQQEYQSFYHRSFRVTDFLPGDTVGVRDLIQACHGVNVCTHEGTLVLCSHCSLYALSGRPDGLAQWQEGGESLSGSFFAAICY